MRRLIIATTNAGKVIEIRSALGDVPGWVLDPLPPGILPIEETADTFLANAILKAEHYSRFVEDITLADDSGLSITALGGRPGVHSARYAADDPRAAERNLDDETNNRKLIREIKLVRIENRKAQFVCVIAAAREGETLAVFEGKAEGIILEQPRGFNGFGYDPLFYFPSIQKTFAELSAEEKAKYSHRGAAFRGFLDWAKTQS